MGVNDPYIETISIILLLLRPSLHCPKSIFELFLGKHGKGIKFELVHHDNQMKRSKVSSIAHITNHFLIRKIHFFKW